MDSAYDHIQEENYPQDPTKQQAGGSSSSSSGGGGGGGGTENDTANSLNAEIQDAYKAISSSPWAARIGGFFGTVKKQAEPYIDSASKQYATTSKTATAGVSTLIGHARNLSINAADLPTSPTAEKDPEAHPARPDSLPADIVKEASSVLSRFRSTAAARFKDIEKAEDAADEALLKFGTNIRNFLADAVSIAPPESGSVEDREKGTVLFESKDSSGKKVVHATRFDAQLHVIHSSLDSFLKDPVSPEWDVWRKGFSVEGKTEAIAKDLEKHAELRSAMEKLVPEKVEYGIFWERYYFLRHVIESEELRRREMLKASTPTADEEVAWDEDSEDDDDDDEEEEEDEDDDDSDDDSTPASKSTANLAASKETLRPTPEPAPKPATLEKPATTDTLKTEQPRRSNDEKSVADSDASYDVVSGATSRAPGSPQTAQTAQVAQKDREKVTTEESSDEDDEEEDSEEEDWE